MGEKLNNNNILEYTNPLNESKLLIVDAKTVWPPYSAFYLAKETFPIVIQHKNTPSPLIVDIGTGSGILAILAKQTIPGAFCVVTDLNPEAVELAKYNWHLNGLPDKYILGIVADGIDDNVITLLQNRGGADILIANLPQQPLLDRYDLENLRKTDASAWNVDPSHDPDGLGIFMKVVSNSHRIMKPDSIGIFSASSKQNIDRVSSFLDGLVEAKKINCWKIVSVNRFYIPPSYDPRLIKYWLEREKIDGVTRLFKGPDGNWQYDHYNIIVKY